MSFSAQDSPRQCVSAFQRSSTPFSRVISVVIVFTVTTLTPAVIGQAPLMSSANDLTQAPVPSSGHDYQQLLGETVNFSNGSVSLKINFPTPRSRGFSIPFAWTYNSAAVNTLDSVDGYVPTWNLAQNYTWPKKDGWNLADGTPSATISLFSQTPPTGPPGKNLTPCNYVSGITFTDISGVTHNLPTAAAAPASNGSNDFYQCSSSPLVIPPAGDGQAIGILSPHTGTSLATYNPSGSSVGTFYVMDQNGMLYGFGLSAVSGRLVSGSAGSISDRNGNYAVGNVDTAGRPGPTVIGSPATSVTTEGEMYSASWSTKSVSFTFAKSGGGATGIGCGAFSTSVTATKNVLSTLTLPNGKQYQFFYTNNYGLLSEIIFPDGGWIKYTYQLSSGFNELLLMGGFDGNHNPVSYGCDWQYQTPVLATRTVSFDGTNVAQTQTFSYTTTWQFSGGLPSSWSNKTTTVNTTDNVRNLTSKTVYSYGYTTAPSEPFQSSQNAAQIPQENSITYYDWGKTSPTKLVTKTWYDIFNLASELTTLYTNTGTLTSGSVYSYTQNPCSSVSTAFTYPLERDDYDYTSASTPIKKTKYNYKCFNPANPSSFSDYWPSNAPSNWGSTYEGIVVPPKLYSEVTEDGAGNIVSATQYNYDEYGLASASPGNYDSTYSSVTARGNVTSVRRCNPAPTSQPIQPSSGTPICTAGPQTAFTFDISGQPATMTDPKSGVSQFSFTDNFTDTSSAPVTNTYLTRITHPNGLFENFQYSYALGYLTTSTDSNPSNVTHYYYGTQPSNCSSLDQLHRLTETDSPDGGKTTNCYNDLGNSVATSKLIDIGSNLWATSVTYRDGMMHGIRNQLTSDPDGTTTVDMSYDGEGQVYTKSNPHRSGVSSTDGTTTYYYDALGRAIKASEQDGNSIQNCYDGVTSTPVVSYCSSTQIAGARIGSRIDTTDEAGNHWQHVSDVFGRLTQVVEPNGAATTPSIETDYSYDVLNDLLSVNQWGGGYNCCSSSKRYRSFTYDALGRLISAGNPETGTATYSYLNDSSAYCAGDQSLPCKKTDARSVWIKYNYDNMNRLTQKTYSDGTPTANYAYDGYDVTGALIVPAVSNAKGRLSQSTVAALNVLSTFSYDPMGRVVSKTGCIPGDCAGHVAIYASYDQAGDIFTLTNGFTSHPISWTYQYDGVARLKTVTASSSIDSITKLFDATSTSPAAYGPEGLEYASFGFNSTTNQPLITFQHHADSRLRPIFGGYFNSSGTAIYSYCMPGSANPNCSSTGTPYTANGNLAKVIDSVTGTWSYGYDTLSRLVNGTASSGSNNGKTACWTYDPFGNRTSESLSTTACNNNPPLTSWALYTASNTNRMDQTSMNPVQGSNYDGAGNEQYDGLNSYLYDGEGRICAITNSTGSLIGYVYDAEGNRVGKGSLTSFSCNRATNGFSATAGIIVGPNGVQLTEITGSGFWDHSNVFMNGILFGTYKSSHLYFGLNDWLGTRRAEVSSSCATTTYSNLPFGTALVTTGGCPYTTEQHFTGKERDSDSGNDYFGARYYTSNMGRFLSPDWSAKIMPIPYAKVDDPQSLNLYAYVRNNPLSRTDADGHYECNGSECKQLHDALQTISDAIGNKNNALSKADRSALQKVVDFYGQEGKKNGVTVNTGANLGGSAAGATKYENGGITISLNFGALKSMPKNGDTESSENAAEAAHEGYHGEKRQSTKANLVPGKDDLRYFGEEQDALVFQTNVNKALGTSSAWAIWTPGPDGGLRQGGVEDNAIESTRRFNGNPDWLPPNE